MSLQSNLSTRLRLLRIALTKRFVYGDLAAIMRDHGMSITDVCGDTEPFSLLAKLSPDRQPLLEFPAFDPAPFNRTDAAYTDGWSSEPSVSQFLGRLVHAKRARTVIELGCFTGWSTVHMAHALRQTGSGHIHYLDYDQRFLDQTAGNLRRLGLADLATPLQGMSTSPEVLRRLPAEADVVFIDTSHEYQPTLEEIALYRARLAPGGCLVLHDSLSAPGVRRAVRESLDRFHVHTFATERSNGLTVLLPRA